MFYFFWLVLLKEGREAAIEVGAKLIGMVNKNTKGFYKETIENFTKDWPGGYHLMWRGKPMVSGGRPLIDIVNKYNMSNVIYFVVTDNAGSTHTGITYLYKYLDQFTNIAIHPIDCPLVMHKFFGSVNEVESHKK